MANDLTPVRTAPTLLETRRLLDMTGIQKPAASWKQSPSAPRAKRTEFRAAIQAFLDSARWLEAQ